MADARTRFYNIESLKWWKFSTFYYLCHNKMVLYQQGFTNRAPSSDGSFALYYYLCLMKEPIGRGNNELRAASQRGY